jgi:hypothetical protein
VTQLAASVFFLLALLASLVAIHVTVKLHWVKIVSALRGELGAVRRPAPKVVRVVAASRPRAVA